MQSPLASKAAARSDHFDFREVAAGTYAAIASERGLAVSNAGVVDVGDLTVVFDTFSSHLAAEDLRRAAEAATGRSAGLVVNSHPHRDHTKGNQVFPAATIIATSKTSEVMARNWKIRSERVQKEGLEPIRKSLNAEFDTWASSPLTTDEDRVLWESYRQSLLHGIEDYHLRLPSVSFESSLRIHGSAATVEALTFGGGHSVGDALLHVPDHRVAFLGDLLFVGVQPFLADGDVEVYLEALDRIQALDATTLIPGHGAIGTNRDLDLMRDYVAAVEKAVAEGQGSDHDAKRAAESVPAAFSSWKWRAFWKENVEFFLRKQGPPT